MDSESDDEIFFGKVTEKEEKVSQNIRNRRTEIFEPHAPLFQHRSSVPSLSSHEEKDEQESENDSKASLFVYTHDLTNKLPSTSSGQLFLNEGSECGSSSQLCDSTCESELKDQEALFVFTPSHKGVKKYSEYCEGNSDITLCVMVNENESNNTCTLQTLPAGISFMSGADSPHSSTDSVLHTKTYSEVSVEKPRIFSNKSIMSEESVDCSSQSLEIQHCNLSEQCPHFDRNSAEAVELVPTSKSAKEVLLDTSVGGEKVLFAVQMDGENIKPVNGTEILIDTSVSGGESVLEALGSGGRSVPETTFAEESFTLETTVSGRDIMPETLISGGDNVSQTIIGKGNCVLETTVGQVHNEPETSVIGGESLPRTTVNKESSMLETPANGGCNVSETTGGRGNSVSETTGDKGNCMLRTTVSGRDMPDITVSGGDSVSENFVPETTLCGGNNVSENTCSGRNSVPASTFKGNSVSQTVVSEGDIVPKTSVIREDWMSVASVTGLVNVPETKGSREDCIPEIAFNGGNSKPEMKVSEGDTVTESTDGGGSNMPVMTVAESVPEISVTGGAYIHKTPIVMGEESELEKIVVRRGTVPDITVTGDTLSDYTFNQEDFVTELKESDLKTFQESYSREKLMCLRADGGENITKPLSSVGLMMKGNLSVEKVPDIDSVGEYYAEKGRIFDNELKKSMKLRQSYYSSLEIISVDSSEVYGDFLVEDDLLGAVDCELPCTLENSQKPCTTISKTLKICNDHLKQREVSFGQIAEKGVSLSVDSSEGDDPVFTSGHKNLESQDCDIPHHERTSDLIKKSTKGDDYMFDEQNTESLQGEDAVFITHGQMIQNNQDNFSSSKAKCSESSILVNNDVKLVNHTILLPKSPVLPAAHLDCLNSSVTVTPPPTFSAFSSISSTDLENLQCSLASSQTSFSKNIDVNSNLNDMDVESYGSANKAVVVSQMEDSMTSLPSSCPSNSSSCTFPQGHHISGSSEENLNCRSPVYEMFNQPVPNASQKSCDTSIDSAQEMQSSPGKFNDTIEEMEMMLKYGVNYGEKAVENTAPLDRNEKRSPHDEKLGNYYDYKYENTADDTIVNPTRKSSVVSKISDFHPALESTRSSSLQGNLSCQRKGSKRMETLDTKTVCYPYRSDSSTKKEPPPKPPRNVHSPNVSPKKNSSFKTSTPSRPTHLAVSSVGVKENCLKKNIVTLKQGCYASKAVSPWGRDEKAEVLTPKQSALMKSSGWTPGSQPLTSGSGLAGVGSLTNIKKASKLGQLPSCTPVSTHSLVRLQHQSPGSRQNAPALQKLSSALSRKLVTNTGLPPRSTPSKTGKFVLRKPLTQTTKLHTPKKTNDREQLKVNLTSKTQSPLLLKLNKQHLKQGLNIVSPVAKYLKENPPPPLVVNIKPRHKISPKKIQSELSPTKRSYQAGADKQQVSLKIPIDHKPIERKIIPDRGEAALSKIQDDLERLALKMKNGQTCVKKEEPGEPIHFSEEDHILPATMYSSSVPVIIGDEENKENKRGCSCREIPTDKQHAIVVKHKGRMKMPKVTFKDGIVDNASPKGYRSPSHNDQAISSSQSCPSVRGSFMEVSLYESHATQYTNTLHLK